jgi:hypothetical protein
MSLGVDHQEVYYGAAEYVAKILPMKERAGSGRIFIRYRSAK